MMKVQKIIPVLFGVLLILFGCNILFDSLSISPRVWILPVLGLALLIFGINSKNKVLRDIGIFLLIMGISVVVNILFIHYDYSRVFYLAVISLALFLISIFRRNGMFVLLATFALMISGIMFTDIIEISETLKSAYTMIIIATAFIVLFTVKSEKLGYIPLVAGLLCYLMSLPRFLIHAGYINQSIAQIISAAILIVAGMVLVIFVYKKAAKENES